MTELVNSEGIGMGLYICKQIVQNMGGTIDCYSAGEGCGSTFMFTMRMNDAQNIPKERINDTMQLQYQDETLLRSKSNRLD